MLRGKEGKDRLTRLVQEYGEREAKYSLQKEVKLIKQKCMKEETAAQNIKTQLKASIGNEKMEELESKPMNG
jgi:hypothetical protein